MIHSLNTDFASPSSAPLGVAIYESNPILSDALSAMLRAEPGMIAWAGVVGQYGELGLNGSSEADVILIDPDAVGMRPEDIRRQAPRSALIAYLASPSDEKDLTTARSCIAAGFRGLVSKTSPTTVISSAILTTARGGIHIDADFGSVVLLGNGHTNGQAGEVRVLSEREEFVLKSFARGMSMKEISGQLDLSSKTVETYKARALAKLNLQSRSEIVEYAIRNGWVQ